MMDRTKTKKTDAWNKSRAKRRDCTSDEAYYHEVLSKKEFNELQKKARAKKKLQRVNKRFHKVKPCKCSCSCGR
jgi:hypothetical protein